MDTTAVCTVCTRALPAWDLPRYACTGCQQTTAEQLSELAELYDQLDPTPGRGAPSIGSRHATAGPREPISLHVIDLVHQVPATLDSWVRCWSEDGASHDLPDPTVAALCRWLRWHLDWACRQHPAADDAIREIGSVYRALRAAATGERPERRVTVECNCGTTLRVTVSTPGAACGGCGTRYGHAEVLALPLARRAT